MRVDVSRHDDDIPKGFVCLGEVLAHFGLRGEVKVYLANPGSTLFNKPKDVCLLLSNGDMNNRKLSIRSGAGKRIIGRVSDVHRRDQAESLIGAKILYEAHRLPKLTDSEWYHHQIIGLTVRTEGGVTIGTITEIVPGEVEVWVAEDAESKVYIPYTDDNVISVSVTDGIVIPDFEE